MIIADSLASLLQDEAGATAIEYALICGLIVIVMVVGLSGFGEATKGTWTTVSTQMETAVSKATAP